MVFRRGGGRIHRAHRRGTFWARSPSDANVTVLAGLSAVIDSTALPQAEGVTVIRMRGQIIVGSDQNAASEDWVGAVGACIVSDQAVAAGVASVPTPYTDQDSDLFFMHQYFGGSVEVVSAAGFDRRGMSVFPFDSKAMRKFAVGSTLAVIVENGASVGLQYWLQFAVLLKVA